MVKVRTTLALSLLLFSNAAFAADRNYTLPSGEDKLCVGDVDLTDCVYIVDSIAGNDSGSGRTLAAAWETLSKVASTVMKTGADVCLLDDSVFEDEQLEMDWAGLGDNPAIIGTCYVDSADGTLRWYWGGSGNGRGSKAEINGNYEPSCAPSDTCPAPGAGGIPTNLNDGLITTTANHVEIHNVVLRDSAAMGVTPKSAYVKVRDVEVYHVGGSAMRAQGAQAEYILYADNVADEMHLCDKYGPVGTSKCLQGAVGIGSNDINYVLIEGNTVTRNFNREGVGCYDSNYCFIRNNSIGHADELLFLANTQYVAVENNVTWGDENISFTLANGNHKSANEPGAIDRCRDSHIQIWRNNATAASAGIDRAMTAGWVTTCGSFRWGGRWYNNSMVEVSDEAFWVNDQGGIPDMAVVNNLLYSRSGTQCTPTSGMTFDQNHWRSNSSVNATCQDVQDTDGLYSLPGGSVLADWQAYDYLTPATKADFTPSGAPLLHAGTGARTTVTSASGTGTVFNVGDADWFSDGWNLPGGMENQNFFGVQGKMRPGDDIVVGTDAVTIESIRYDTNEITVTEPFTWVTGDDVCWKSCTVNVGYDPDLDDS